MDNENETQPDDGNSFASVKTEQLRALVAAQTAAYGENATTREMLELARRDQELPPESDPDGPGHRRLAELEAKWRKEPLPPAELEEMVALRKAVKGDRPSTIDQMSHTELEQAVLKAANEKDMVSFRTLRNEVKKRRRGGGSGRS